MAEGIEDVSSQFGKSRGKFGGASSMESASSVPLMAMPIYMQFARSMGGRSYLGRSLGGMGMGGMGGMGMGGIGGRRPGMSAPSGYGRMGDMGFGNMYMV